MEQIREMPLLHGKSCLQHKTVKVRRKLSSLNYRVSNNSVAAKTLLVRGENGKIQKD